MSPAERIEEGARMRRLAQSLRDMTENTPQLSIADRAGILRQAADALQACGDALAQSR